MSTREPDAYDVVLPRLCDALTGACLVAFVVAALHLDTGFALAFAAAGVALQLLRPRS